MPKVSAWFRSHPLTTIFVALVGFAAGTHFFANWRAEVRWQRYAAEARVRGVKLALTEFAAPKIPDAENFAALPMFKAIFAGGVQRPMELPAAPGGTMPMFGDAVKGEGIDWKVWQKYCAELKWISETTEDPARDVLRGLEHYAPQFAQWREWRQRSRSRFDLDLKLGAALPLPHLSTFLDAGKLFSLRMRAHLALRGAPAAYTDFQDGLQSYRALVEEPTLIAGLVQIAALSAVLGAVGEGLGRHAWDERELTAMAGDLSSIRVGAAYAQSFASERGFGNQTEEETLAMSPWQRSQRFGAMSAAGATFGTGSYPSTWIFLFVPKRVYRDNQLRYNLNMDELCGRVTEDQRQFLPSVGTPTSLEEVEGLDGYYYFLFARSNGVFHEVARRYAQLQTQLDEARAAIALERFRLARGTFPENLAELVPDFIEAVPVDTYSQQPLIYRRKEGGTFQLYGVGKDRKDDGGEIDPKVGERKQRDDVWLHVPTALFGPPPP